MKHRRPCYSQHDKMVNGSPTPRSRRTGSILDSNTSMLPPQTPSPHTSPPHTEAPTTEPFSMAELESEDESFVDPRLHSPRLAVTSTFRMGMDCLHRALYRDNLDWIQEIANEDYDIIHSMWTVVMPPDEVDTEEEPVTPSNSPRSSSMAHTCEWLTTEVDRYRQLNLQMEEAELRMVKKLENLQAELALARLHFAKNIPLPTPPPTTPASGSTYASAVSTNANNKTRTVNPKSEATVNASSYDRSHTSQSSCVQSPMSLWTS